MSSGCLTPAFLGAQHKYEMRRPPFILGGPQHQARGAKSEVAASPRPTTPSAERKIGSGCLTCGFLGPKNRAEMLCHPLHSQKFPTTSAESKMRNSCPNPTFSGGQKRAELLCHTSILGAPQHQARGGKSV